MGENKKHQEFVNSIVGKAVSQPTTEEQQRQERLSVLEAMRITTQTEVVPEEYALSVNGVGFFALSDLHGLKGKQKSGKSAVLKVCAAALLSGQQFRVKSELEAPKVLFIDTEQKAADTKLVIDELVYMTRLPHADIDERLLLYNVRTLSYDTLIGDTRLLVEEHQPQVVFIDGVVDYVASFNDEVLSRKLIHDLLLMCEERHCAIVCVLHENKASDDQNMRGHLGTVLSQKAGSVLQCQKLDGLICVCCPDARHGTMPQWSIMFDNDGHICNADELNQQKKQERIAQANKVRQEKAEQTEKARLNATLAIIRNNGGSVEQKELKKQLEDLLNIKSSTFYSFLKKQLEQKTLFKAGDTITASTELALQFQTP